jgi:hypothetical protein
MRSTTRWGKTKETARGRKGGATTNYPRQKDNKSILLEKIIVRKGDQGKELQPRT